MKERPIIPPGKQKELKEKIKDKLESYPNQEFLEEVKISLDQIFTRLIEIIQREDFLFILNIMLAREVIDELQKRTPKLPIFKGLKEYLNKIKSIKGKKNENIVIEEILAEENISKEEREETLIDLESKNWVKVLLKFFITFLKKRGISIKGYQMKKETVLFIKVDLKNWFKNTFEYLLQPFIDLLKRNGFGEIRINTESEDNYAQFHDFKENLVQIIYPKLSINITLPKVINPQIKILYLNFLAVIDLISSFLICAIEDNPKTAKQVIRSIEKSKSVKILNRKIPSNKIKGVIFNPFSLGLLIQPREYEKNFIKTSNFPTRGMASRGAIEGRRGYLARYTSEIYEMAATIIHENLHIFLFLAENSLTRFSPSAQIEASDQISITLDPLESLLRLKNPYLYDLYLNFLSYKFNLLHPFLRKAFPLDIELNLNLQEDISYLGLEALIISAIKEEVLAYLLPLAYPEFILLPPLEKKEIFIIYSRFLRLIFMGRSPDRLISEIEKEGVIKIYRHLFEYIYSNSKLEEQLKVKFIEQLKANIELVNNKKDILIKNFVSILFFLEIFVFLIIKTNLIKYNYEEVQKRIKDIFFDIIFIPFSRFFYFSDYLIDKYFKDDLKAKKVFELIISNLKNLENILLEIRKKQNNMPFDLYLITLIKFIIILYLDEEGRSFDERIKNYLQKNLNYIQKQIKDFIFILNSETKRELQSFLINLSNLCFSEIRSGTLKSQISDIITGFINEVFYSK